jgi:hypothetical protein
LAGCVVSKKRKNWVQFLALCRGEVTGEWHVEREREGDCGSKRERERRISFLLISVFTMYLSHFTTSIHQPDLDGVEEGGGCHEPVTTDTGSIVH